MRKKIVDRLGLWALGTGLLLTAALLAAAPQDAKKNLDPIPWAYNPGGAPPSPVATDYPDKSMMHAEGSTLAFNLNQVHDRYGPADWFPKEHGAMPPVVQHGNGTEVWACSLCHLPNGQGRPENAGVAGLPMEYFVKQMSDFRNGLRTSADAGKFNTGLMISFAKNMNDDQIHQAAEYFGALHFQPWIKVIESNTVPKTKIDNGLFIKLPGNAVEPLGNRIVEMTTDEHLTEDLRDDHVGFSAYVPPGSVKKGEALVKTGGNGVTIACVICHGATLRGVGPVPPLAGRSPSYIARQLNDMQHGTRYGSWSALMTNAVVKLTPTDIVDIAAYLATQKP